MHTAMDRGGPCGPPTTLLATSAVRSLNKCKKYPSPGGKERQLDQQDGPKPVIASQKQQSPEETVLPKEYLTIGQPETDHSKAKEINFRMCIGAPIPLYTASC